MPIAACCAEWCRQDAISCSRRPSSKNSFGLRGNLSRSPSSVTTQAISSSIFAVLFIWQHSRACCRLRPHCSAVPAPGHARSNKALCGSQRHQPALRRFACWWSGSWERWQRLGIVGACPFSCMHSFALPLPSPVLHRTAVAVVDPGGLFWAIYLQLCPSVGRARVSARSSSARPARGPFPIAITSSAFVSRQPGPFSLSRQRARGSFGCFS